MSSKSFPDPDAITIEENNDTLKVMSWNLWWKFEDYLERQKLIFSEIEKLTPDIMCFQEVWEEEDESQADKIAKLLSKQLSIKKGKHLESEELQSLLDDFFGCKETTISPFNKPIFITLEKSELDQKLN